MITTDGVVLRERTQGEIDKFIDVLTDDMGIISICVKGGRKLSSKNSSATQLFSYSKFCYNQKGERNILNSSEIISSFFNISSDIEGLALASYYSELLRYSSLENIPSTNVKRLLLNCLYYLDNKERSVEFLKLLFEFRLVCEIGLIPNLIGCCECYEFQSNSMYFDILNGKLYCSECFDKELDYHTIRISDSELHVLRHIALTDFNRLFNFKISDELQSSVGKITEKYTLAHFDHDFKTLKYYKSIKT